MERNDHLGRCIDRSYRRVLVGSAGCTAGQVGPDATLVQHARELRGLGRTPASTHADYADLRNWSSFEPQFGLCGQPLVHLFEAVVNDGPSLIRTRKPVVASTVRFDSPCINSEVRLLFQRRSETRRVGTWWGRN